MKTAIPDFNQAKVLVVGDVMLDRYWHGGTSRISPEAPVPVVHINDREDRPGGAANVALNIAALEANATVLGLIGDDEAGTELDEAMVRAGVESALIRQQQAPTVTKLRVISRHQQLIRLDFEDGFARCDHALVESEYTRRLESAAVVVLSDYGKGTLRSIQSMIQQARAAGKRVLIDPKGTDFSRYKGASLITPNLSEFEAVVGACIDEADIVAKAEMLMQECDLDALLVTRGEQGMSLLQRGLPALHLATEAREVFDVTGAGDTVIAVLAAVLAAGHDLAEATFLANIAAGIVVAKLGTANASVFEIQRVLSEKHSMGSGVVTHEQLMAELRVARAHNERIVITNGCFDLLHAGHVSYLQAARRLGDRLIVAVNSDASVKRLKGDSRPINPLDQRMTVLAALECVDWVVDFGQDTPEELICSVLPDVLSKGGDYQAEDIAGYQCVTENGGEVIVLHFEDGCSTSSMIERIKS
ncbi:MAG: bifunctional D-glycero-beta-D-manno-heptose-7-phosphate kinase/D-glycero-beta-D-manno-heptose 1-phosphate adenylyltransferase HldE [Gammaproteobacteria bacterium]|nr:bifunctional D-glycero-beta-D-manno-heptose-7-phosphate kinase/D-glycero-beta-D-manno-heptose 1-phosphate adenylyltransferase HldE [Gammaproteobacteria bacterium]